MEERGGGRGGGREKKRKGGGKEGGKKAVKKGWEYRLSANFYSLSRAVNVSAGMPRGVLSLARRQYCADSYVAQNHSTESQLPT